jgi:hypothetical protein
MNLEVFGGSGNNIRSKCAWNHTSLDIPGLGSFEFLVVSRLTNCQVFVYVLCAYVCVGVWGGYMSPLYSIRYCSMGVGDFFYTLSYLDLGYVYMYVYLYIWRDAMFFVADVLR